MDRREKPTGSSLSAVKTLATVRNLVARTNVIQIELLHPPTIQAPVTPIMPGANGTNKAYPPSRPRPSESKRFTADWQASWNQWASARAERGRQTDAH